MKKNKILVLIIKEKSIFISGFILGIIGFILYLIFMYMPFYKTTTNLFIRNIPKQDIIADFGGGSTIYSESGFSNPLFNLVEVLKSDVVSIRVYKNLKAKYPKDLKEMGIHSQNDWISKYKNLIKAQIQPSTDIINISFRWFNPKTADKFLNEIIANFKEINLEIRQTVELKQRIYLDSQLIVIADQLDQVRKRIKNYKVDNNAVDIPMESSELTKARVGLQKESEILTSKINYYDKKLSDLKQQVDFKDTKTALKSSSIGEDVYLIQLNKDLAIAQQKYAELNATFTDNYPDVIAVKNEIDSLKKNISIRRKETLGKTNIKRGVYDKQSQDIIKEIVMIQAEKLSTISELNSLRNGIQNLIDQESTLPNKIMGLDELQKEADALAMAYERIKQKQLEATIKENEIVDNVFILNYPSKPKYIYATLIMKFIGLMGIVCLFSAIIAIIKEDIENKWTDVKEVEEITGVKVLGVIPWLRNPVLLEKDSMHFIQKSDSILGISYGETVSNIVNNSYQHDAQSITFVSTVTSRGKSFIIPNLTATLARLNKSVILVVTDYEESQKILNNFGVSIPQDKTDMLDVIERLNIHMRISRAIDTKIIAELLEEAFLPIFADGNEMFQLLYTKKKVNVYDYVGTRGFYTIIEFLKQYYEFILIDTPVKPLIFPEFSAISNVSDAVIIVSAMETNRDGLINTIDKFKKLNTRVLGVIAREENKELEEFFTAQLNNNVDFK